MRRARPCSGRTPTWRRAGDDVSAGHRRPPNDLRLWALMAALRRGATAGGAAPPDRRSTPGSSTSCSTLVAAASARLLSGAADPPSLLWRGQAARLLRRADRHAAPSVQAARAGARAAPRAGASGRSTRWSTPAPPSSRRVTPYFYCTYEEENEAPPLDARRRRSSSAPGRSASGRASSSTTARCTPPGRCARPACKSVMINSNPETVSHRLRHLDRLYFEPLDEESVRDVLDNEAREPTAPRHAAGRSSSSAARRRSTWPSRWTRAGAPDASAPTLRDDRPGRGPAPLRATSSTGLGIPQPPGAGGDARSRTRWPSPQQHRLPGAGAAVATCSAGGRWRSSSDADGPGALRAHARRVSAERSPILIDKYLEGKEVEVDAICDGDDVLIPGIMEHIERAGVHSGDSHGRLPAAVNLTDDERRRRSSTTPPRIGAGARRARPDQHPVRHLRRAQVYVLEVNPRASRTVPFLSKVTGVPMVRPGDARACWARRCAEQGYAGGLWPRAAAGRGQGAGLLDVQAASASTPTSARR